MNDDGSGQWQYWQAPLSDEQFLRCAVDRVSAADLLCWGVGSTRYWYSSQITEDIDTGAECFDTVQEWMAHTTLRRFRERGRDPLSMVCQRGHKHGMHVYASLRMNDGHFAFDPPSAGSPSLFDEFHPDQLWNHQRGAEQSPITPQFWRDHPELRIGEDWPGSKFAAHLFDYSHVEVRDRILGIIQELVQKYDIDGIELDFMRNPFFFKPGEVAPGIRYLNDFVQEARRILDRPTEKTRQRRLGLAVRCPMSVEGCERIGMDVPQWIENSWVDVVTICPARFNKFEVDLRPLIGLPRGQGCQLLFGMDTGLSKPTWEIWRAWQDWEENQDPRSDRDDEQILLAELRQKREGKLGVPEGIPIQLWRALSANAYQDGVDGIYVFNLWDQIARHGRHSRAEILKEVRSPTSLVGKDKLYSLDFDAGESGVGHPAGHLGHRASLPAVLEEGCPVTLNLRIADDLAVLPVGMEKLREVRLHLLLVHLTPVDQFQLTMDGTDLESYRRASTLSPDAPTGPNSAFVDVIYSLESCLPRPGVNHFVLTLTKKNRQVRPSIYLRRFELSIRFENALASHGEP